MAEAITIVILGSISGLKNVSQIHQWATDSRVSGFLKERFGIEDVPCYYWLISSRRLTAVELLHHARMEWTVETMHWLLDVHFGEE